MLIPFVARGSIPPSLDGRPQMPYHRPRFYYRPASRPFSVYNPEVGSVELSAA